jgi:hypothetical protein
MTTWWSRLRVKLRRSANSGQFDDTFSEEWAEVTARARGDMEARRVALLPLLPVVGEMSRSMLNADPIGLRSMDSPDDEYDPEAETVVVRLSELSELPSQTDVLRIVHEEFVHWFGDVAGPEEDYLAIAAEVHRLWGQFLASDA